MNTQLCFIINYLTNKGAQQCIEQKTRYVLGIILSRILTALSVILFHCHMDQLV